MKQLYSKHHSSGSKGVASTLNGNGNSSNGNAHNSNTTTMTSTNTGKSTAQQQQPQPQHQGMEYKFRCSVLPEHFTSGIPFVRVNQVMEYDWFVRMPDTVRPGNAFVFIVTQPDLQRAQYLQELERNSTLTAAEQLEVNTKIVNEICQELVPNTQPNRDQQYRILQAIHPFVPIITNSAVEGTNHTPQSRSSTSFLSRITIFLAQLFQQIVRSYYVQQVQHVLHYWYKHTIPDMYVEICFVDVRRFICVCIGFSTSFVLGFLVAVLTHPSHVHYMTV
jgi:hypothetical protein